MLIQHHTKYEEIHGVDEIVMMTPSDHKWLHLKLRREKRCTIPAAELNAISCAAHHRSNKYKEAKRKRNQRFNKLRSHKMNHFRFQETIGTNVQFTETIMVNPNTGTVWYGSWFYGKHGKKLKYIDI